MGPKKKRIQEEGYVVINNLNEKHKEHEKQDDIEDSINNIETEEEMAKCVDILCRNKEYNSYHKKRSERNGKKIKFKV